MPAAFFQATDTDKPGGLDAAYKELTRIMTQLELPLSPALAAAGQQQIRDGMEEIWDGLASNIADLRAHTTMDMNTAASDLEIAIVSMLILKQKFLQYVAAATPSP